MIMLKKEDIQEIHFEDGRVTKLRFSRNITPELERTYVAEVSPDKIILGKVEMNYRDPIFVAEYDRTTGKSIWGLRHCCGASGFGQEASDKCYACDTPGQRLEATPQNMTIVSVYTQYRELLGVLSTEIPETCRKLEDLL